MKPRVRVKAHTTTLSPVRLVQFPAAQSRASVVETIGTISTMVADGKIDSIAIAAVWHDGCVTTAYANGREMFALVGGVERLKSRLLRDLE